jgi:hypothetical protein
MFGGKHEWYRKEARMPANRAWSSTAVHVALRPPDGLTITASPAVWFDAPLADDEALYWVGVWTEADLNRALSQGDMASIEAELANTALEISAGQNFRYFSSANAVEGLTAIPPAGSVTPGETVVVQLGVLGIPHESRWLAPAAWASIDWFP